MAGFNSLDVTKKELIPEWSSNNERPMSDFSDTASYRALWVCPECNGEYPEKIYNREIGDVSCPYCINKRVLPGFNSFKVQHKDLMDEWDYINNYLIIDPNEILDSYSQNVWWICRNISTVHKYQMSPKNKIYYQKRNMQSCSVCKGRRRKRRHFI